MQTAMPPSPSICFLRSSRRSIRRAASATFAPSDANPLAIASPIPLDAPVTMVTLPLSLLPENHTF